ncbi:PREDICTED: uncharacterized protein LOC107070824 [Polistes dominula]|uniref:Uncharacterized protein LOC107070824 n=1 Tax=Polistes dominula TaxID=743375 RepID=A0ABM1IX99_POLDO|nr:PREDICTED: uncharacterized protein LOC107070824 [Polistes dominula]XP_015184837.1 PREDICTED: uncharacterized protein LOC107070824 [Polistes dominula]
MEKIRSLSGDVGCGVLLSALFFIYLAFGTPEWLVSDPRILGAQFEKMGLWVHCLRSLPRPYEADAPKQFFVGCRWVYDPFTTEYNHIWEFSLPRSMIATQLFFTVCCLLILVSFGLMLLFILCCRPTEKRYILLIKIISYLSFTSGIHGAIAVIIFACMGNTDGWMSGHTNNYFGWSFAMAVVGTTLALIASILFLIEANIQNKKHRNFREFQMQLQLQLNA